MHEAGAQKQRWREVGGERRFVCFGEYPRVDSGSAEETEGLITMCPVTYPSSAPRSSSVLVLVSCSPRANAPLPPTPLPWLQLRSFPSSSERSGFLNPGPGLVRDAVSSGNRVSTEVGDESACESFAARGVTEASKCSAPGAAVVGGAAPPPPRPSGARAWSLRASS